VTRLLGDLRAAVARFLGHDGFLLASALSFACVLCLAPLTLILFSVAGFLMEAEIDYLGRVVTDPAQPVAAIIGGADSISNGEHQMPPTFIMSSERPP